MYFFNFIKLVFWCLVKNVEGTANLQGENPGNEVDKMGEYGWCFIYLPCSVPSRSSGARDLVPGWRWKGNGLLMLYQAVWFYYCSMWSRSCPFQHSCLVNYVVRKEHRSHRGSPRSESRDKYHERSDPSVWKEVYEGGKPVWHWAMHAKNNRKAATQGECPSHKPRVLLAKSSVCISLLLIISFKKLMTGSYHRRIASLSILGQYLLPTKLLGIQSGSTELYCTIRYNFKTSN